MRSTNMKLSGLLLSIALTFGSFGAYAGESHMAEALKHAEATVKAADEHLNAGITRLNDAIDHAKMKHLDLAKKSAEEAVTHLKAAQ